MALVKTPDTMNEADQQKITKEVTVVAYSTDADSDMRLRRWAEKVTGIDCTSYDIKVEKSFTLNFEPEGSFGYSKTIAPFSSRHEDVEKVKEDLESKGVESLTIDVEEKSERSYSNSPGYAARQFVRFLFYMLPEELEGSMTRHQNSTRWNDEQDLWGARLWSSEIDEMRVLSKEEKRENDDLYETMAERPCFSFVIKMEAPDESYIDTWTEQVVPECVKFLSRHPHIGKVRFMDCVTKTEQEGECYSL